jgi:hypothetical protein
VYKIVTVCSATDWLLNVADLSVIGRMQKGLVRNCLAPALLEVKNPKAI